MHRATRPTRAIVSATTVALTVGALLAATPARATPARRAFPGSVPSFVSAKNDAGPADEGTVEGEIYLPLRDGAGAQKLATAVSTPGNANYGKYLTPAQWIARFSPSQPDFDAVEAYLKQSGLTVSAAPKSREFIVFRGPAGSTESAFGTTLRDYRVGSATVSAPSRAPSVPAALASKISGIGLGNSRAKLTRPTTMRPADAVHAIEGAHAKRKNAAKSATDAAPCSDYYDEYEDTVPEAYGKTSFPTDLCGYTPKQLRSAGGLNPLINSGVDGSGQTIGIIGAYASPTIVQDTNDYMRTNGSPLLTRYKQIVPTPSEFNDKTECVGPANWQLEQTLDIEAAHSVAPGATILYSGGFNCDGGIDIAVSRILDDRLATVVSNSYADLGEDLASDIVSSEQSQFVQAAAEGIGMYFASGDDGDDSVDFGHPATDFPASSPFVTAVGGTSEAIGADGKYVGEVGFGTYAAGITDGGYDRPLPGDFVLGAGGGVSSLFDEPAYQRGVVPGALAHSGGDGAARVVPDVADVADPFTGFLIGQRTIIDDDTLETGPYETFAVGGTSLATPITAAKMTLVQAKINRTIGFANPLLYATAKSDPSAFHDVTPGDRVQALAYTNEDDASRFLITLNQSPTLYTDAGYDTMTGIGSLNTTKLAKVLRR